MRTGGFRRACAMLCCILLVLMGALAYAVADVEMECSIGYDGIITYLRQLPINVKLTNHGADAVGMLAVDVKMNEQEYDRYEMPVTIASGATVEVSVPVILTTKQSEYRVQWLVDDQPMAEQALKPSGISNPVDLIVGVLSEKPQGLTYLNITKTSDILKRGEGWKTVPLSLASFPGDLESMEFFDILAVDGVDMELLGDAQKAAFDAWLQGGGIVLLGGGAQAGVSFPYFTKYTGISAGPFGSGGDISQEWLSELRFSEDSLGKDVMCVELTGASGTAAGASRLMDVTRINGGTVCTAAFSLSDKPFSAWQGENALWQRILLQYAQTPYLEMVARRAGGGEQSFYASSSVAGSIGVPNASGMAAPLIVLAVFVALAGFGGYWLLKRLDKRGWMWVTVPSLCVMASLFMWLLSGMLNLQTPIATSYTVVTISEEGAVDSHTAVTAAQASPGRMSISAETGTVDLRNTVGYYYYPTDPKLTDEPSKLRYQYTYGEPNAFSFPEQGLWEPRSFVLKGVPIANCDISGECGWDGDSLVFVLQNNGDVPLEEGVIITDYGFVSVAALLPGQTVTARLTPPATPKQVMSYDDIKDGLMINEASRANFSNYDFVYSYAKDPVDKETDEARAERERKRELLNDSVSRANGNSTKNYFHYFAFSDQIADARILINGQAVTRTAQWDMVNVALSFNPVSEDGTVRFLKGSFPVYNAEENKASGVPRATMLINDQSRYSYFNLSLKPIFGFDVSSMPDDWTLSNFNITPSNNAYLSYQISLYNVKTGEWDEYRINDFDPNTGTAAVKDKLLELENYVDAGGMLYAQFQTYGKTDNYAEVSVPVLTMDGRLK